MALRTSKSIIIWSIYAVVHLYYHVMITNYHDVYCPVKLIVPYDVVLDSWIIECYLMKSYPWLHGSKAQTSLVIINTTTTGFHYMHMQCIAVHTQFTYSLIPLALPSAHDGLTRASKYESRM